MFHGAKWIWGGDSATPDQYMEFLLPVEIRPRESTTICLSCDGDYAIYWEDALVSFGQYADYPHYRVYDRLELSALLPLGAHTLRIVVWHMGVNCFTYVKKAPGLLFSLWQGETCVALSDERVPCRPAPGYVWGKCRSITGQLGMSFCYDARQPAEEYRPAVVMGEAGELHPRPNQKTVLRGRRSAWICASGGYRFSKDAVHMAKKMQKAVLSHIPEEEGEDGDTLRCAPHEDGVYAVFDLDCEECGFAEIEIEVPCDCEIGVGWGEHLSGGRCRTDLGGRSFAFTYLAQAGRVQYLNPFRRLGARYLQVFIGAPWAKIHYVGIRPVEYPLMLKEFSAGDPLRDRIYATAVRTLQLCMHEHYEDCPWREQSLYTLDSRNQMLCGYYAFGETEFPRSSLELISHGVRADGLLSLCYPAGIDRPIPAFSLIYPMQMAEYLEHARDVEFIRKKYPMLQELLSVFLRRKGENRLIPLFCEDPDHWNFYEWSEGLDGEGELDKNALEAPLNAFLSLALASMERMAEALELHTEASFYAGEREALNRAIGREFFCPERGLFATRAGEDQAPFHVLTNSLCLLCGAAEGVEKQHILQILAQNGAGETDVIPDTLSMVGFRYDALLREDGEAYREVILSEIDRVWGAMLDADATSFWETAEGEAAFGGAGSLCHGWSALPVYYYHKLLR